MKKTLIILCMLPHLAWAQEPVIVEKKIACNWLNPVLENLAQQYQERPVWVGRQDNTNYSLLVNPERGTWTLIQFNKEIACVIGSGNQSQPLPIPGTL